MYRHHRSEKQDDRRHSGDKDNLMRPCDPDSPHHLHHEAPHPPCCDGMPGFHDVCPDLCDEENCKPKRKLTLKALVVVAEDSFQKIGDVEVTAPPGVGIDPHTGKATIPMHLEPIGAPVFKPVVLQDKLVNEGFLRVRLIVDDLDPHRCPDVRKETPMQFVIPFQSIRDMEGICPGDLVQEHAEIEGLLISVTPSICDPNGTTVQLTLKAILKVDVVVSRECLVTVVGKTLRCLPACPTTM